MQRIGSGMHHLHALTLHVYSTKSQVQYMYTVNKITFSLVLHVVVGLHALYNYVTLVLNMHTCMCTAELASSSLSSFEEVN